jgi:hypothetical protein
MTYEEKAFAARDPSTPHDVLRKFSEDKDDIVRRRVARNPNAPHDVLRKFSENKDWMTRYWVAKNSNTPSDILQKLRDDPRSSVSSSAEKNLENRKPEREEV